MRPLIQKHDLAGTCRLSGLQLCSTCGKLRGDIVVSPNYAGRSAYFQQQCHCQIPAATRQSDRDLCHLHRLDFPQMFDLCHCCGGELICSGSRLSWLFCRDCRWAIEQLNDLCDHCVIPIGRHTFMAARWGRQSFNRQPEPVAESPALDPEAYQLALKRQLRRNIRNWSERIDRVTRFGMRVNATHIGDIATTRTSGLRKRGLSLRAYLRHTHHAQRNRSRCFQALGLEFLVPYQVIRRVAGRLSTTAWAPEQRAAVQGGVHPQMAVQAVSWQDDNGRNHYGFASGDDLRQWQQLEQAVQGSANWKQFRQACPLRHRQVVCRAFRRAGVPAPPDHQPFLTDDLPTDVLDPWHPRPGQAMLEWMPAFLVEEFGALIENGFEAASVQFREADLHNVARILKTRYGHRVALSRHGPLHVPLGR